MVSRKIFRFGAGTESVLPLGGEGDGGECDRTWEETGTYATSSEHFCSEG